MGIRCGDGRRLAVVSFRELCGGPENIILREFVAVVGCRRRRGSNTEEALHYRMISEPFEKQYGVERRNNGGGWSFELGLVFGIKKEWVGSFSTGDEADGFILGGTHVVK